MTNWFINYGLLIHKSANAHRREACATNNSSPLRGEDKGEGESITNNIAAEIIDLLRQKHLTIGTVESATGGLIAHLLTNVPGSSDVFKGSIIAYGNEIKKGIVGVKPESIEKFGAVSPQVAEEMAAGGRALLKVDICIADTGIAGPGGATPGKPVGLFYLGLADKNGVKSQKHNFAGARERNKMAAALAALEWAYESLR